jgi:hypothetical protein
LPIIRLVLVVVLEGSDIEYEGDDENEDEKRNARTANPPS